MRDIWSLLKESFDITLPRMNAIAIKENDYDLGFYTPSRAGRIGYNFLDTNLTVYNQDRYTFEFHFAAYEYPNLCGGPGKSEFLFSEQTYRPGQIAHTFRFSNSALCGSESLSAIVDGGLLWSFELSNSSVPLPDPTHIYRYSKKLYSVFISHDGFSAHKDNDGVICIELKDNICHIAGDFGAIAVFDNELDAYEAMGEGFSEQEGRGRVLVIETPVAIDVSEKKPLRFGISCHGREKAIEALAVEDADAALADKWNSWFEKLPTVGFDTAGEREQKLYYKAWWTIRQNFCDFPGWGFNVLESLPVYKGIWQWAIPAVEWYSSQDPEHSCEWISKAMEILLGAQREDGYITHAAYIHEKQPGLSWMERGIIQNPQLPGTALRYYNVTEDIEALKRWYSSFERYYSYLCREFDERHENLHLWALHSSYDPGLDTFPSFQEVTYGVDGNPPTEYCYGAILSAERYHYECSMGKIAELCGIGDAKCWYEAAALTKAALNNILWDADKKWYGVRQADGRLDTRVGIDGMFPLIYEIADEEKLAAMKKNFESLIGPFGIRTCAENEPGFFSDIYWRGPCWPKSCSLAVFIAKTYYPELSGKVMDSVLSAFLKNPNIWECVDAGTGELARSNVGFYCTPCMSSNVGAGELIGALWMHHGMNMFGTERRLCLVPMTDYHYCGMRITVEKRDESWFISAKAAERDEAEITFVRDGGSELSIYVTSGKTVCIQSGDI